MREILVFCWLLYCSYILMHRRCVCNLYTLMGIGLLGIAMK